MGDGVGDASKPAGPGVREYEGHRISYGLILTTRAPSGDAALLSFENKRFKTLTDGFSTALLLDRRGGLAGIVALVASS